MSGNYNKDPRIINYHKNFRKNTTIFRKNKYISFSMIELNYIVNQTEFKYDNNKLYILNLNDYIHYYKKRFLICQNGFYCDFKDCIYMHVKPNLICPSNHYKIIICNKNICDLIHIKKCKFENRCVRSRCVFIHDKNKK
jgi:hypothetical protein